MATMTMTYVERTMPVQRRSDSTAHRVAACLRTYSAPCRGFHVRARTEPDKGERQEEGARATRRADIDRHCWRGSAAVESGPLRIDGAMPTNRPPAARRSGGIQVMHLLSQPGLHETAVPQRSPPQSEGRLRAPSEPATTDTSRWHEAILHRRHPCRRIQRQRHPAIIVRLATRRAVASLDADPRVQICSCVPVSLWSMVPGHRGTLVARMRNQIHERSLMLRACPRPSSIVVPRARSASSTRGTALEVGFLY